MDRYSVTQDDRKVGTAEVSQQGLYYQIQCLCDLTCCASMHIYVEAEHSVDLGICVPIGDRIGLKCSIPVKRIGKGTLKFFVRTQNKPKEQIIAFSSDMPFAHIAKLKDAYLIKREGNPDIAFRVTNRSQVQPGSDQSP